MWFTALIQQQRTGLEWAAGFDEGGVGHYFESDGDMFTVGVPDVPDAGARVGTGIVLYSDCSGDADAQECALHFISDGDTWNARSHDFTMDDTKQLCTGSKPAPEGSECVFNAALGAAQDFRRISKQVAGAAVGTTVENFHTVVSGKVVAASFTVTADTQAWCDDRGTVVSFTNLRLSQTRNVDVPEGKKVRPCAASKEAYTSF